MIKKIISVLMTVSIALSVIPVFSAEVTQTRKTAEAAYGTPVIDGEIDAVWSKANYYTVENDRMAGGKAYKGWFKVLWDEERLYVLSKVYSENYSNTGSASETDSVDIYIDEDMQRGSTFDGNDYQLRVNYLGDITGNNGISEFDFAKMKAVGKTVDGGFITESSFPLVTVKPTDGLKVGFEIQMNASPTSGGSFRAYLWNTSSGWVWNKPDCYGTLELKKTVNAVEFIEPTFEPPVLSEGYKSQNPVPSAASRTYEYKSNVNVSFDSTSCGTYGLLLSDEYPEMAIDELAEVIGGTATADSITKDGKTLNFTEGQILAEDENGHWMLEREPKMYEGKLYVPVSIVESYYVYMYKYNRFDNTLKITTGTDYPDPEVIVYASDFGTVGDGVHDDGPAILKAVNKAISSGKPSKVVLDANKTYLVASSRQDDMSFIRLLNVKNFTLDGQNSEIIMERAANSFLHIESCTDIKILNLDFDYKEVLHSQGRIKSVDVENGTWVMTIDDGYPLPASDKWVKNFWTDARTGGWWFGQLMDKTEPRLKFTKYDNYFVESVKKVEGTERDYLIKIKGSQKSQVQYAEVGDRFVLNTRFSAYDIGDTNFYGQPSALFIYKSGDVVFDNVNIYCSAHLGALVGLNWGRVRFLNYGMKTKDDRLLCTNSDGIHCFRNRGGVVIENCKFMNNLDDHINTKGEATEIKNVIDDYTYYVYWDNMYEVGDEVVFYDPNGKQILGRAYVTKVEEVTAGTTYNVTVDRKIENVVSSADNKGYYTTLYNANCSGKGSVIRNNEFWYSRRHAYITRSQNSVFEGNKVIECGGAAVMAGNEHSGPTKGGEGPFPSYFTMRNNYVKAPGITSGYYPVEIRSHLSGMGSPYCIDGFLLENNDIIVDTPTSSIWAYSCENLYFINNRVTNHYTVDENGTEAKIAPVTIQNSHIALIDGLSLDCTNRVESVITLAGCDVDESSIKNITSNNNEKPFNNYTPVK